MWLYKTQNETLGYNFELGEMMKPKIVVLQLNIDGLASPSSVIVVWASEAFRVVKP